MTADKKEKVSEKDGKALHAKHVAKVEKTLDKIDFLYGKLYRQLHNRRQKLSEKGMQGVMAHVNESVDNFNTAMTAKPTESKKGFKLAE